MDPVHDQPLEDLRAEQEARLGRTVEDEELLLRLVMAPDVLEAVLAAGPAPVWGSPKGPDTGRATGPVHNLGDAIRAVNALPNWRSVQIRRGHQHLRLTRRDPADREDS